MLCFDKSENITRIVGSKFPRLRIVTENSTVHTDGKVFEKSSFHDTLTLYTVVNT